MTGIVLHGGTGGGSASLLEAVTDSTLTLSISEASSLTMTVRDAGKRLWRSGLLDAKSWLDLSGRRYELASHNRVGPVSQLEFIDQVAARMQANTGYLKVAAGGTRAAFLARLARDSRVPALIDPGASLGVTRNPLERGTVEDPTSESSWEASGRVADEVHWRRFTDGARVIAGSDAWLTSRARPVQVREHHGGVEQIDVDIDLWQRTSTATLTVQIALWSVLPGLPVVLVNEGPGSGAWLVDTVTQPRASTQGTVTLTRRTAQLPEPAAADVGDPGQDAALPSEKSTDTGGNAYVSAAGKGIAWGMSHLGDAYVYGAKGPRQWDCSGFVTGYVKAGGGRISGTAAGLLAACEKAGTVISVGQAARTRGALLFNIGGGAGASGNHIAIALGNGQTLQAHSRADGVCVLNNAGSSQWTAGALVPGF